MDIKGTGNIMNKAHHIIACENCVLERVYDKYLARQGNPEDYLCMSTGIVYNEKYLHGEERSNLDNFLETLFPDPETRRSVLYILTSILLPGNRDKKMYLGKGNSHGGKTKFAMLMEATFGNYYRLIPYTIYTASDTDPSGPTPHLETLEDALISVSEESNQKSVFKSHFVKNHTGNQKTKIRRMYAKKMIQLDNTSKLWHFYNLGLMFEEFDDSIETRLVFVPFKSRITTTAPSDLLEQKRLNHFRVDPLIDKKIPGMAKSLLALLVSNFQNYYHLSDIPISSEMKAEAESYWRSRNWIKDFFRERIIIDDSKKTNLKKLYARFEKWYQADGGYGIKVPMRTHFSDICIQHMRAISMKFTLDGDEIKGIALK
jgi:phage/plasmid-associated DNA primase